MMNDILHALDNGDVTFVTLLDLSAAFDSIDHNILSHRLEHLYGISGTSPNWFRPYLSNRTQTVTISNKLSQPTLLNFGVPQGSVLGPILFILYTKPLTTFIRQHSISNQSFAHTQLPSRSNRHFSPRHVALHFRCKDMDDVEQTQAE